MGDIAPSKKGQFQGRKQNAAKRLVAAGLIGRGATSLAVQAEIGVTRETVSRWCREPEMIAEIERVRAEWIEEHRQVLRLAAGKAATRLIDLLYADSEAVGRLAAMDVLRAAGVVEDPTRKVLHRLESYSTEQLIAILVGVDGPSESRSSRPGDEGHPPTGGDPTAEANGCDDEPLP